ncbi:MAG: PQQ-binding-like beta-propeller repeat protein [Fimbriimonadales bacterium]
MKTLTLSLLIALAAASVAQDPWPMERQDRWGTGRAIIGPDPLTITTPWVFKSFEDVELVSHGPALAANGQGYVNSWVDNATAKFDQTSGALLGTYITNNWGQSSPAIGLDGEYYAATVGNQSETGKIYRINPDTMLPDWSWNTYTRKLNDWESCSPTVGPDGHILTGSSQGYVYKLHRTAGMPIWTITHLGGVYKTVVFTRDDSKIIVCHGNNVSAFEYATGWHVWTRALNAAPGAAAVAPNGLVILGSANGNVYGLDPNTGNAVWFFVAGGATPSAPAFSPDGAVTYLTSLDHRLYALRSSDGANLWSWLAAEELRESPSVDTIGRIYFATRGAAIHCINPDGSGRWAYPMEYESRGSISIGPDNTLYVPNGALRIIRQQATSYAIKNLVMERGTLVSGGIGELRESDDSPVKLSGPANPSNLLPIIQVVLSTDTLFAKPTKFSFQLETRSSTTRLLQVTQLFNYTMNRWDQVDSRPTTLSDNPITINVNSGAADYQDGTGSLKARLLYMVNGALFGLNAFVWIDQAKYTQVVPRFEI